MICIAGPELRAWHTSARPGPSYPPLPCGRLEQGSRQEIQYQSTKSFETGRTRHISERKLRTLQSLDLGNTILGKALHLCFLVIENGGAVGSVMAMLEWVARSDTIFFQSWPLMRTSDVTPCFTDIGASLLRTFFDDFLLPAIEITIISFRFESPFSRLFFFCFHRES